MKTSLITMLIMLILMVTNHFFPADKLLWASYTIGIISIVIAYGEVTEAQLKIMQTHLNEIQLSVEKIRMQQIEDSELKVISFKELKRAYDNTGTTRNANEDQNG